MSHNFAGKSVLVTGGVCGIGRAIADAFTDNGAHVSVTGLTEAEIESCRESTDRLACHQLDVSNKNDISRLSSSRLDALINAAGMGVVAIRDPMKSMTKNLDRPAGTASGIYEVTETNAAASLLPLLIRH
jgi:NADP-dependent 3-hydroxy acid dehydrogenase YdfG